MTERRTGGVTERLVDICTETARLTERELQVVRHRFWCSFPERITMAEIAERLKVSRDTVVEAEASAMRKLKSDPVLDPLKRILAARKRKIWRVLAGGQDVLKREELLDARSRLAPDDVFLILLIAGSLEEWLDRNIRQFDDGWKLSIQARPPTSSGAEPTPLGRVLQRLSSSDIRQIATLIKEKDRLLEELEEVYAALDQIERKIFPFSRQPARPARPAPTREPIEEIAPLLPGMQGTDAANPTNETEGMDGAEGAAPVETPDVAPPESGAADSPPAALPEPEPSDEPITVKSIL